MKWYLRVVGKILGQAAALAAISFSLQAQPTRAIVIGVDGLSVEGVKRADAPNLRRLMRSGAWTLSARGVMPTLSSPNWASMITGAGTEQHGITSNGWFKRLVEFRPVCEGAEGKFPTIFDALRAQRPEARIGIFHDWDGFSELVARSSTDEMRHERGTARTTEAAIRYWRKERPELLFVHLDNVDHAGHRSELGSVRYYRAVGEADRRIGALLAALDEAGAFESTYVLVTSDHGGTPRGHGRNSLAEIQIPWILAGPGVASGEIPVPVNTFDTAATLAWIFGLDPLPCAIGKPVTAAFSPPRAIPAVAAAVRSPACASETRSAGALIRPAGKAGQANE